MASDAAIIDDTADLVDRRDQFRSDVGPPLVILEFTFRVGDLSLDRSQFLTRQPATDVGEAITDIEYTHIVSVWDQRSSLAVRVTLPGSMHTRRGVISSSYDLEELTELRERIRSALGVDSFTNQRVHTLVPASGV